VSYGRTIGLHKAGKVGAGNRLVRAYQR